MTADLLPKISVITVTLNRAASLRRTIESIAEQTYQRVEYLVIDGGSTDGTHQVAHDHVQIIQKFISEPDKGIYDAMNKGMNLCSGDVIGFLNSDDVYSSPHSLERVAQAFADPAVEVAYGDLRYTTKNGGVLKNRTWRSTRFEPGDFLRGWMPPHPTFFIRRSVLRKLRGFDLRYHISADYEFMLRALEIERARSTYIPFTLVDMAPGGISTKGLSNIVKANWECLVARRTNGLPSAAHLLIKKPLSKLLQLRR